MLPVLIGIIGGIIAGMGMGGGTLLIPLLTLFLGYQQKAAQTVTLISFVFMAGIALFIHFRNRLVVVKPGLMLAVAGLVSAIITALLTQKISGEILKILFGVFLIVLAVIEFIGLLKAKNKGKKVNIKLKNNRKLAKFKTL